MKDRTYKSGAIVGGSLAAAFLAYYMMSPADEPVAAREHSPAPRVAAPVLSGPRPEDQQSALREMIFQSRQYQSPSSPPIDAVWACRYVGVDMSRPTWDQDGDGVSNLNEMVAGTNPIEGNCPKIAIKPINPEEIPTEIHEAPPEVLAQQAQARYAIEAPAQAKLQGEMRAEAVARGIPLQVGDPDRGGASVLHSLDSEGNPVYLTGSNIHLADAIRADEVWPTGDNITTPPGSGWAVGGAGSTYNNLNGGAPNPPAPSGNTPSVVGQQPRKIALWEVTGLPDTSHPNLQLNGTPRVILAETGDSDSHATAVAGIIASGGTGTGVPEYSSRGIAYKANLRAYKATALPSTLDEAASPAFDFRGGNQSMEVRSGFSKSELFDEDGVSLGLEWTWWGGDTTDTEDWKLGGYSGAPYGPLALDNKSSLNPYLTTVVSAGNTRNIGATTAPASYYNPSLIGPDTRPRDWKNGDQVTSANAANADTGYDTLNTLATAKNALVVGSVKYKSNGYATADTPAYEEYSGAGPTDDGRIKPDVVAADHVPVGGASGTRNPAAIDGPMTLGLDSEAVDAYASCIRYTQFTNSLLGTGPYEKDTSFTGTSSAAASMSGAIALILQQRGKFRPWFEDQAQAYFSSPSAPVPAGFYYTWNQVRSSQLRALAIHCATDIGLPGPDYRGGYGVINVQEMTKVMRDNITNEDNSGWMRHDFIKQIELPKAAQGMRDGLVNLSHGPIHFTVTPADPNQPLKVTFAWTDSAGPAQTTGSVDDQTKRLNNDFDVRIYKPGNATFTPTLAGDANVVGTANNVPYKPWTLKPDMTQKRSSERAAAAVRTADDVRNNVEMVVASPPLVAGGIYVVRVTPKTTNTDLWQWGTMILSNVSVPASGTWWDNQPTIQPGANPGEYSLAWPQRVGGVYQVQYATTLIPGSSPPLYNWQNWTGPMSARQASASLSVSVPPTPPSGWVVWKILRRS
jgi:Subtilase family